MGTNPHILMMLGAESGQGLLQLVEVESSPIARCQLSVDQVGIEGAANLAIGSLGKLST